MFPNNIIQYPYSIYRYEGQFPSLQKIFQFCVSHTKTHNTVESKLYEYFEDTKNVYLITEICHGGELFDKIIEKEFFDEKYAAKVFK